MKFEFTFSPTEAVVLGKLYEASLEMRPMAKDGVLYYPVSCSFIGQELNISRKTVIRVIQKFALAGLMKYIRVGGFVSVAFDEDLYRDLIVIYGVKPVKHGQNVHPTTPLSPLLLSPSSPTPKTPPSPISLINPPNPPIHSTIFSERLDIVKRGYRKTTVDGVKTGLGEEETTVNDDGITTTTIPSKSTDARIKRDITDKYMEHSYEACDDDGNPVKQKTKSRGRNKDALMLLGALKQRIEKEFKIKVIHDMSDYRQVCRALKHYTPEQCYDIMNYYLDSDKADKQVLRGRICWSSDTINRYEQGL